MRLAYLDCFAGIAGDMFLGALVDAGVPVAVFDEAAAALDLGATYRFESVDRSGITACKAHVMVGEALADAESSLQEGADSVQATASHGPGHAHPHPHPHAPPFSTEAGEPDLPHVHGRSLTDIRQLLQQSTLATPVKALALTTFELLGYAEAKIHNVPVDEIHFHEVGAVDAILDIVGACAGIVHLAADAWHCSPVNVGGGTVRCAHGVFPVPAPATARLLRGMPTYGAHLQKELVTPTGAALLCALQPAFGAQPAMAVQHIGYGAGTRNPPGFANVLRLSVGTTATTDAAVPTATSSTATNATAKRDDADAPSPTTVAVLETALDDATPQLLAYAAEQALAAGALDVMLTPAVMKKGRPGTLLTVLAAPQDAPRLTELLLRETTTLGVRVREEQRVCLERGHAAVPTPFGTVRVKTGSQNGEAWNAHPEYEDCKRLAQEHGVPLKQVAAAAMAAWANLPTREEKA